MALSKPPLVVALDGSSPSWEAFQAALSLAASLGAELYVVTALGPRGSRYFYAFVDEQLKAEQATSAEEAFTESRRRGEAAGVRVLTRMLEAKGHAAEAILEFLAGLGEVTMLVVGSYGRGYRQRHFVGSTTERLIRQIAKEGLAYPVLVVPATFCLWPRECK
jgi:nucleotide-binding universal stress UspA family protein